ncbi:MAG: transporter substrate-binding domain-containing protein [Faecousia sp.]
MKKLIAMMLALCMVLSLAACGSSEPAATEAPKADAPAATEAAKDFSEMTIDELKPLIKTVNPGKLTMVTSPDFAPYEFYALDANGTPSLAGFDPALGQYIADFIGLELEIIPMDFDGTITELGMGNADIGMAGYSPDPAREKAMSFSTVYYTGGQAFVCHQDNAANFTTLEDANKAEYQIGAQLASIQADLAKQHAADADIVELGKVTDIIAEVISGKLDGAFIEKVVAETYAKNYPELCVVLDVPYDAEGSVVGVNKDNAALLAAVNLAIEAALADGSMSAFVAEANELSTGEKYEGLLTDGAVPEA